MIPPFAEAAFALADSGDVSPNLVETTYGYHIIRLLGRRTAMLMDTTQARLLMTRQRQRDAFEAGYRALCEDAVIRVNASIINANLNTEAGD
jgi:peptidyl-prolyl cis-trans isomerase C